MRFTEISARGFHLAMTLDSGQVFHWEKVGNGFVGTIGDLRLFVEQRGDVLKWEMEGGAPPTPGERRDQGIGLAGVRRSSCAIGRALLRA